MPVVEEIGEKFVKFDRNNMLEVRLLEENDFLKIKETLTRIGVPSKKYDEKKLYASCHILHKTDKETGEPRYYIVHFKELFGLDGNGTTITENDIRRRNTIALLLEQWDLLEIVDRDKVSEEDTDELNLSGIKIIPYAEKDSWELCAKYKIGNKKRAA